MDMIGIKPTPGDDKFNLNNKNRIPAYNAIIIMSLQERGLIEMN